MGSKYAGRRKLFWANGSLHTPQLFSPTADRSRAQRSRERERGASLTEVHVAAGRGRQIFVTLERVVHLVHPGASIGSRLLFNRRSGRQLAGIPSSHHLLFGQKGKVEKKKSRKKEMGIGAVSTLFLCCTTTAVKGMPLTERPKGHAGMMGKAHYW